MFGLLKRNSSGFFPPSRSAIDRSDGMRKRTWESAIIASGMGGYLDRLHPIRILHIAAQYLTLFEARWSGHIISPSENFAYAAEFYLAALNEIIKEMPNDLFLDLMELKDMAGLVKALGRTRSIAEINEAMEYFEACMAEGGEHEFSELNRRSLRCRKSFVHYVASMGKAEERLFLEAVGVICDTVMQSDESIHPILLDTLPATRRIEHVLRLAQSAPTKSSNA